MTERRHILIVGAGAIGVLYAAYLAKVADVAVLDTNRAHVDAIQQNGLKLTGCTESVTKLAAFASAAELGPRRFDAVIILVKSQATEAAFDSIRPGLEGRPALVTFQNGMGNEEVLMGLTDLDVAHGVSFEAARYDAPGRVHHLVHGEDSWLGPARGKAEAIAWLGELMTRSGLPTKVVADPRGAIWGKFIFNSVMNPIGAIVQGVNAARYEVPEMRALIDAMAAECIRVAEAQGPPFFSKPRGGLWGGPPVAGELGGNGFVLVEVGGDKPGKAQGVEQATRHTAGKSRTGASQDRQPRP